MDLVPSDNRVELPLIFKHLIISVIGISGLFLIFKGEEHGYTDTFLVFGLSIFSSLATFGLASIIAILKQGKGIKGIVKEFYDNLDIIFKDDRKNKQP
tara:strand:- start:104 stop:397 length:294 start_codon:yes stop_codon:yes gene_type:complete